MVAGPDKALIVSLGCISKLIVTRWGGGEIHQGHSGLEKGDNTTGTRYKCLDCRLASRGETDLAGDTTRNS